MKKTTFNCDPVPPKAILTLEKHRYTYPSGMCVYFNGRSRDALYISLGYVIYETKNFVVVREMKCG